MMERFSQPYPEVRPVSSLSTKQMLSVVALVVGVAVFLATVSQLGDFGPTPQKTATEVLAEARKCIDAAKTDSEIRACSEPDSDSGPWYNQHPVLAALIAGTATFFVIAGSGRLFMK